MQQWNFLGPVPLVQLYQAPSRNLVYYLILTHTRSHCDFFVCRFFFTFCSNNAIYSTYHAMSVHINNIHWARVNDRFKTSLSFALALSRSLFFPRTNTHNQLVNLTHQHPALALLCMLCFAPCSYSHSNTAAASLKPERRSAMLTFAQITIDGLWHWFKSTNLIAFCCAAIRTYTVH